MRVALIPPADLLHTIADRDLHMVIPEGLQASQSYRDFYRMLGHVPGPSVLMDNGAFEAAGPQGLLGKERLAELIHEYNVDQLVLPDVMGDHSRTIDAARGFLHYWEISQLEHGIKPMQFMVAVQGADANDLRWCIDDYVQLQEEFEMSFIFGLPKWTSQEIEVDIRMKLAGYIQHNFGGIVHLLGMSRVWPREVEFAQQTYPDTVRSVDTAAPYVYAINGALLESGDAAERPDNYFTYDSRLIDQRLLAHNLSTLGGWISGK